jgi:hypothetical protein
MYVCAMYLCLILEWVRIHQGTGSIKVGFMYVCMYVKMLAYEQHGSVAQEIQQRDGIVFNIERQRNSFRLERECAHSQLVS